MLTILIFLARDLVKLLTELMENQYHLLIGIVKAKEKIFFFYLLSSSG